MRASGLPRLTPVAFERLSLAAAVAVAVIIVTGGAVRLTGSGLGCPHWPTCTNRQVVGPLSYHQLVEFLNRLVTAAVSVLVLLTVAGSLLRQPRRRDLVLLSTGLVAGVLGQIVLGGLTVLYKLAPPFVMGHFLLSMAILWDAVVLHHRAVRPLPPRDGAKPVVDPDLVRLGRLLAVMTAIVLVAGTVVTSSGPHGGDPSARRWDLDLHRVTQIHGTAAMLVAALALAMLVLLRLAGAPPGLRRRSELVVEALAIQIGIGYTQYFTGVPPLLVGAHIFGAVLVWTAVVRLNLALTAPALASPAAAGRLALVDA
jgi:heme a synthase